MHIVQFYCDCEAVFIVPVIRNLFTPHMVLSSIIRFKTVVKANISQKLRRLRRSYSIA